MPFSRYCCTLLLVIIATCALAQESQVPGRKDCLLNPQGTPATWQGKILSWDGPCKDGKAEGTGVLRAYSKGSNPEIFYGQVHAGVLQFGVMEVTGGFKAGQFISGVVQENAERNLLIKAFSTASSAAKAYSERLQRAGNNASAKFYAKKSQELATQMD